MYVCLCLGITTEPVHDAIESGASTSREVVLRVRCGLGMRSLPADRPRNHRRTRRQRCGAEARAVDEGQAASRATVAPSTPPSVAS